MENVSKALLIAAGILIAIMVISFMMLVLRKAGRMSAQYDTQMSENELAKFNSQFEDYAKADNTFFDVITVANLAWDVNKKNGYDEQNKVEVKVTDKNNIVQYSILSKENLKKNYFFKGENGLNDVYIYNDPQSNLDGKSLIDYYTKRKDNSSNDEYEFKYLFNCTSISYHETTGKVKEMIFQIKENT